MDDFLRPAPRFSGPRARRQKKAPKQLVAGDALVKKLLGALGYDAAKYAVFEIWDRLLGSAAAKARAVGLKGRQLYVEVDSSARMHDLTLRKRALLRQLNGHFGTNGFLSDIILQLASDRRRRADF